METQRTIPGLRLKIQNTSTQPGVYQFFDNNQKHMYVGKAKNLRKRIVTYFTKNHPNTKIRTMVKNIFDLKCIVVDNEQEALLLENNLIKKHKPRYNVMFRDDKTYPWICIKNEPFPRVFLTRKITKDGSNYFGPYTSITKVKDLLFLIHTEYQLRSCNYSLTPKNIYKKKFEKCLEYHLNLCQAPCENLQPASEYETAIGEIKQILKGNVSFLIKDLTAKMTKLASCLEYEGAQKIKERIDFLKEYQGKSVVVSPTIKNLDVYSIVDDEQYAYINFLKIINGAVCQSYTLILKKKLNETKEALLSLAMVEIRQKIPGTAPEIILPFKIEYQIANVSYTIPERGQKRRLLELSTLNALNAKKERLRQVEAMHKRKKSNKVLQNLQKDLRLKQLPTHIECFDNSNIQGDFPVAACVVFKNGKPAKSQYRHYNIKTVKGIDDFLSMQEIVFRRYKRLLNEKKPLPQLIIIDGGKGQLSAAIKSLKSLDIYHNIAIVGLAKRLEEVFFPDKSEPLYLDRRSESLRLIQRIRNEAHRFSISFHRQKRSKKFLHSELLQIKGIGEKSVELLFKKFLSVEAIQDADFKGIAEVIGKQKARLIESHFKRKEK